MFRNVLAGSRYLMAVAALGALLAALVIIIYGGVTVVNVLVETFSHAVFTVEGARHLSVECIEMIDVFLLGAVLYITALGLYELFIDEHLPTPAWLVIKSLEDLKSKLLSSVIVLLAVSFLGIVVTWDGSTPILYLGIAVGIVIFALAFLQNFGKHGRGGGHYDESTEESKAQDSVS